MTDDDSDDENRIDIDIDVDGLQTRARETYEAIKQWTRDTWNAARQRMRKSDVDKRAGEASAAAWQSVKQFFSRKRVQLALGAIGAVLFAVVTSVVAGVLYGTLSGVATAAGFIAGGAAPWCYVRVVRVPILGSMLATAFYVLAQLTYGAGAIVRREDGRYEWRKLRNDGGQLYAELQSGTRVDINGSVDELPTLAWAPVAIVEVRTEQSLSHITVDEKQWEDERPDPQRGATRVIDTPLSDAETATDGGQAFRIDACKLERWCRGSADSEPVRAGLRKALEEEGGEQQINELYLWIIAAVMLLLGFGLTAGVMLVS